jgi:hypothetical protein
MPLACAAEYQATSTCHQPELSDEAIRQHANEHVRNSEQRGPRGSVHELRLDRRLVAHGVMHHDALMNGDAICVGMVHLLSSLVIVAL